MNCSSRTVRPGDLRMVCTFTGRKHFADDWKLTERGYIVVGPSVHKHRGHGFVVAWISKLTRELMFGYFTYEQICKDRLVARGLE